MFRFISYAFIVMSLIVYVEKSYSHGGGLAADG